jgi:hypothetical protein
MKEMWIAPSTVADPLQLQRVEVINDFLNHLNNDLNINGGNCKVEPNQKSAKNTPAKIGINGKEAALIEENYPELTRRALGLTVAVNARAEKKAKYMDMHEVSKFDDVVDVRMLLLMLKILLLLILFMMLLLGNIACAADDVADDYTFVADNVVVDAGEHNVGVYFDVDAHVHAATNDLDVVVGGDVLLVTILGDYILTET